MHGFTSFMIGPRKYRAGSFRKLPKTTERGRGKGRPKKGSFRMSRKLNGALLLALIKKNTHTGDDVWSFTPSCLYLPAVLNVTVPSDGVPGSKITSPISRNSYSGVSALARFSETLPTGAGHVFPTSGEVFTLFSGLPEHPNKAIEKRNSKQRVIEQIP